MSVQLYEHNILNNKQSNNLPRTFSELAQNNPTPPPSTILPGSFSELAMIQQQQYSQHLNGYNTTQTTHPQQQFNQGNGNPRYSQFYQEYQDSFNEPQTINNLNSFGSTEAKPKQEQTANDNSTCQIGNSSNVSSIALSQQNTQTDNNSNNTTLNLPQQQLNLTKPTPTIKQLRSVSTGQQQQQSDNRYSIQPHVQLQSQMNQNIINPINNQNTAALLSDAYYEISRLKQLVKELLAKQGELSALERRAGELSTLTRINSNRQAVVTQKKLSEQAIQVWLEELKAVCIMEEQQKLTYEKKCIEYSKLLEIQSQEINRLLNENKVLSEGSQGSLRQKTALISETIQNQQDHSNRTNKQVDDLQASLSYRYLLNSVQQRTTEISQQPIDNQNAYQSRPKEKNPYSSPSTVFLSKELNTQRDHDINYNNIGNISDNSEKKRAGDKLQTKSINQTTDQETRKQSDMGSKVRQSSQEQQQNQHNYYQSVEQKISQINDVAQNQIIDLNNEDYNSKTMFADLQVLSHQLVMQQSINEQLTQELERLKQIQNESEIQSKHREQEYSQQIGLLLQQKFELDQVVASVKNEFQELTNTQAMQLQNQREDNIALQEQSRKDREELLQQKEALEAGKLRFQERKAVLEAEKIKWMDERDHLRKQLNDMAKRFYELEKLQELARIQGEQSLNEAVNEIRRQINEEAKLALEKEKQKLQQQIFQQVRQKQYDQIYLKVMDENFY